MMYFRCPVRIDFSHHINDNAEKYNIDNASNYATSKELSYALLCRNTVNYKVCAWRYQNSQCSARCYSSRSKLA